MHIVGHGIDIIETHRVARLVDEHGDRFLERCYTDVERAYADTHGADRRRLEFLAGRFAAKEAILKVLGTGWRDGIAWTDAEIRREPSGRPHVVLHGVCQQVADKLGIDQWWISISHTKEHAIASAIGVASAAQPA